MAKTIVGLYDDRATADRVAAALKSAGFTRDHVQYASSESGSESEFSVDASAFRDTASLTRYGVDEDEAGFYGEGLRRGGSLVVVRAQEQDADAAVDILAEHNPVRYDDRSTAYKASGFTGYQADAPDYSDDERQTERAQYAGEGQQRPQEIQEAIQVGTREVVRGATRVDTEDVSERVMLREESVRVDRVSADRELTAAEADAAFQDKTVEVVAHAEEAVVEKTARVTGEVVVGLDANERQETVGGTVRSTHVEVDESGASTAGVAGGTDDEAHFAQTYGQSGRTFAQAKPAYDYGRTSAATHGDYDTNETAIRSDYESRNGDSAWDDVKDAVRHGFTKAKNAVS